MCLDGGKTKFHVCVVLLSARSSHLRLRLCIRLTPPHPSFFRRSRGVFGLFSEYTRFPGRAEQTRVPFTRPDGRPPCIKRGLASGSSQPTRRTGSSQLPRASTMASGSQQTKGGEEAILRLNPDIQALHLAKDVRNIPSARTAFSSISAFLAVIRVCPRIS